MGDHGDLNLLIGDRLIGRDQSVFLIAEVGLAHDGSLGAAHAYIDAVSACNVDAVKFQTHIAEEESTSDEKFRVRVFPQDATRFDYWRRTSFTRSQWRELAAHAREKGLLFLSSPFSNLAVDWLVECDVPAWKVASGELTNFPMLKKMCQTGKPLLVSSGMSSWQELQATIDFIVRQGSQFAIFQCTTAYPCPPEKWGLNIIPELISRFSCPVGLSDHSGYIAPGIAATALGASMLEFHVAFSKTQFGPDAKASLTFEQTRELVHAVRQVRTAMHNPINKDALAASSIHLHQLFTKSIVASRKLSAGHSLTFDDLAFKKPGTGIGANRWESVIGKVLKHDVVQDHFFAMDDFF
jgi:N,N'-diacetyllegionaminate synthase